MTARYAGPALAGFAAIGLVAAATTPVAADMSYEEVVDATSMVEAWIDGELPNPVEVTYDGPPISYRYATYLPEVAGLEKVNARALEQLERESNGKITYDAFYAQSLHPQAEAFTAVRSGVADYSACFMVYEPTSFHLMHGLALPFLFESSSGGTLTAMNLYPKYFKEEYENMEVYLGRQMVSTPFNVIGNHAYRALEDFRGSKIRAGSRMHSQALRALGAVPINLPSGEAYTSLQRGLVDGVTLNDPALAVFKLQEISRYHNAVSLFAVNMEHCLNVEWFDSLPDDLKQVYYRWIQKTNLAVAQLFYERDARRARELFVEQGLELVQPDAEEIAKWAENVAHLTDEWIETNEEAGRPASAMLEDLVKVRDRYRAMSLNEHFQEVYERPVVGVIDF